jgi:hypothetical protein
MKNHLDGLADFDDEKGEWGLWFVWWLEKRFMKHLIPLPFSSRRRGLHPAILVDLFLKYELCNISIFYLSRPHLFA